MADLTQRLAKATGHTERHRVKARAFASLKGVVGTFVRTKTAKLTITSQPAFKDDLLQFNVKVERGGKDVTPPDMNPIRVWNPPVLVPDRSGDVVRIVTDVETGAVTEVRYREDLRAAMMDIIRDLVRD